MDAEKIKKLCHEILAEFEHPYSDMLLLPDIKVHKKKYKDSEVFIFLFRDGKELVLSKFDSNALAEFIINKDKLKVREV